MENQVVVFKIEGEFLKLSVDPNKNGVSLLDLSIKLSEIPAEVLDALKKK